MRQIPITNPRVKDNQWLNEAFNGVNNSRTYEDFTISDNYWIYLSILANAGGSGVDIKGDIDCSGNPNYPLASKGDAYRVSVAGKIGGASGFPVSVGDVIIAWVASAAGTQAAVGANWNIKQVGLQRIFEVTLSTGDVVQTGARDWTSTLGRNRTESITGAYLGAVGGSWDLAVVGTWSVSGTNFGVNADGHVTAGIQTDIAVGIQAYIGALGNNNSSAFGFRALRTNAGLQNSAFGADSQQTTTNGANNSSFGYLSLQTNTTGSRNTAVGASAHRNAILGNNNTAVGFSALLNGKGDFNTAIGSGALGGASDVTGTENVGVGASALSSLTSGSFNTAVGDDAMNLLTTGSNNTAVGLQSGKNITTTSGGVFLGYKAGFFETGANKLFIDNAPRASEADGRLKALVYGIFDALTANQFFTLNAHVLIREDLQFTTKAIDTTAGDAVTINSPAGRFRKDTSDATFTLTNSYITANSIIVLEAANAAVDATATSWTVLAGVGSAVITFNAAPTANFDMNFLVIN